MIRHLRNLRTIGKTLFLVMMLGLCIGLYALVSPEKQSQAVPLKPLFIEAAQPSGTATPTIPPYTPLASLTPSQTLKPPPTLEPPTSTPQPSYTPSTTPTATLDSSISVPGLHGVEASPTAIASSEGSTGETVTTAGENATTQTTCEPRNDWGGVYVVQLNDALSTIAPRYGLTMFDLARGNCLKDMNLIAVGQKLRVPGDASTTNQGSGGGSVAQNAVTTGNNITYDSSCQPWEAIIPVNNTININSEGTITFQWRGPEAFRYLLRIIGPTGGVYEEVFDLRQNQTINASEIQAAGQYTWYVYPLNENFQQINCKEGGPWVFTKEAGPTATPTMTPQPPQPNFMTNVQGGVAPLEVLFVDQSQGTITEMLWSFGDGSNEIGIPGSLTPIRHLYTTPGSYLVTLWVKGPNGESSTSKFITVN